jgi:hypothetical protein
MLNLYMSHFFLELTRKQWGLFYVEFNESFNCRYGHSLLRCNVNLFVHKVELLILNSIPSCNWMICNHINMYHKKPKLPFEVKIQLFWRSSSWTRQWFFLLFFFYQIIRQFGRTSLYQFAPFRLCICFVGHF